MGGSFLDDMHRNLDSMMASQPDEFREEFDNVQPSSNRGKVVNVLQDPNTALTQFYENVAAYGIDLTESEAFMNSSDPALVVASAGVGKTTTMVLKILRDLISGDTMTPITVQTVTGPQTYLAPAPTLVMTFSNSGVKELKAAFRDWVKKLNISGLDQTNIKFKTIHGEVKSAIEEMGVKVNILKNTTGYLKESANHFGIRASNARSNAITLDELKDLEAIIMFARNRIDNSRYMHQIMPDYGLTPVILDALLADFAQRRKKTGQMDFEDMQEILLDACRTNPAVAEFIGTRYSYIYLDEAQDTSQLQYALLQYYGARAKRVTIVGDDDQTIYSWRGSDNNIILERFIADFAPKIFSLSTNYRVPSVILNAVIPSIEKNTRRHYKPIKAHKSGGELYVDYSRNVNNLMQGIKSDMRNNMTVAVIARTNADLLAPAIILELANEKKFSVSGSVGMTGKLERQIFGAISLTTKRLPPNVEEILKLVAPRHAQYEVDKLLRVLKTDRQSNLFTIALEDIIHSAPSLVPFMKGFREAKRLGDVDAYIFLITYLELEVFASDTAYSRRARDLIAFCRDLIATHPALEGFTASQLEELFTVVLPEKLVQRSKYKDEEDVLCKLTTGHDAKGKQWDSVYIWNDIDGCFPSQAGSRELTADEYEEERRLHYIAWTRPKKKLTALTQKNAESPFLRECDLSEAVIFEEGARPIELGEKERVFDAPVREPLPLKRDVHSIVMSYVSNLPSDLTDPDVEVYETLLAKYRSVEPIVAKINEAGILTGEETDSEVYLILSNWMNQEAEEAYGGDMMDY